MKCIPGHIENRLGFVTKRLTVWLVCLVVVLAALTLETHLNAAKAQDLETPVRQRIPLDGTWDFSLKEPAPLPAATVNQGHVKTSGTIQVPGIWEVQGYGQPTDKVRHLHVGKATYKRTVSIPADWKGKEIVIVLEGFQRYAQVSINDRIAGPELLDGVVANEVRVDHLLVPGKEATVSVCVDSEQRWPVDAIMSCAALNHVDRGEFVHFPWGGLWGHVWLEARSSTRITDHLIRYQFAQNRCKAEVVVKSPKADDYLLRLNVCELNGTVLASQTVKCPVESDRNTSHSVTVALNKIEQWTPESPQLYRVDLILLKDNVVIDRVSTRYGFRDITIRGPEFLLNGAPYYLIGYGEDHVFPYDGAMPNNKETCLKVLRLAKAYGFNHIRPHSTIMPQVFYDACDEIGMLVIGEFPIVYPKIVPGTGWFWHEKVPHGTDPQPGLDLYKQAWEQVIRQYRHHASICIWCGGNELFWCGFRIQNLRYDFERIARTNDPDRPFIHHAGDLANNRFPRSQRVNLDKKLQKEPLDLYVLSFDYHRNPLEPGKYDEDELGKPIIAHEAGNCLTFPRVDMYDKFDESVWVYPFWMKNGIARLKAGGLYDEAGQWSTVSEQSYLLHFKYNVEQMRLKQNIVGYHWWLFQDFWTTSNGLIDYFNRPKSIKPDDVKPFQSTSVILQTALPYTARGRDAFQTDIVISNYGKEMQNGTGEVVLLCDGKEYCKTKLAFGTVARGKVQRVGQVKDHFPNVMKPTCATLVARACDGDTRLENSWPVWIYPQKCESPQANNKPIAIYSNVVPLLPKSWNVKEIPDEKTLPVQAVYVVKRINPAVADALNRGAGVILFWDGGNMFPTMSTNYNTSWWKAGDYQRSNDCGQFAYSNEMLSGLTKGNLLDVHWFTLCQGSRKYLCDEFARPVDIVVRVIPGIAMIENNALLAEVGIGKGTLILSGFNHTKAATTPENETLLRAMIERSINGTRPKTIWANWLTFLTKTKTCSNLAHPIQR